MSGASEGLSMDVARPFAWVALVWAAVGTGILAFRPGALTETMPPFLGLFALCLLDVVALAKAIETALRLATITREKRGAALIQTFFWGTLKLVCVGIFILVLSKGVQFSLDSQILGLGTMVVVPLVGGYFWSRRDLEHA